MNDERLDEIERRLSVLEDHRLPERVATLEAGLLRVERQLELALSQGRAASRSLGELTRSSGEQRLSLGELARSSEGQRLVLDRVAGLLEQFVRQQTPSVEVSR